MPTHFISASLLLAAGLALPPSPLKATPLAQPVERESTFIGEDGEIFESSLSPHLMVTDAHLEREGGCDYADEESKQRIRELEARALYESALRLTISEDFDRAIIEFQRLIDTYPESPFITRAQEQIQLLQWLDETEAIEEPIAAKPLTSGSGRAELIFSQTIMGMNMGLAVPIIYEAETSTAYAIGLTLGAVAGIGVSTAISKRWDVTVPMSQSIYFGQLWTAYNLQVLSGVVFEDRQDILVPATVQLISPMMGAGLGYSYHHLLDLSAGQNSLAFSNAIWGSYLGTLAAASIAEETGLNRNLALMPLAVGNAALFGTAYLVQNLNISRSRVRLINLGGFLGNVAVFTGFALSQTTPDSIAGFAIPASVGTAVGLATGYILTSNWDAQYHPEVFDTNPGGSLLSFDSEKWSLSMPMPMATFSQHRDERGELDYSPQVNLTLAQGRW